MQFFTATVALFAAAVSATSVQVRYDTTYDSSSGSLLTTSCSDGVNGLVTKGYSTFGSLPKFPNIGASIEVPSWNSPNCGKCYAITYNGGAPLYVIAVDTSTTGWVLSKAAMDTLTHGLAGQLGTVTADYVPTAASNCGF